jgi:hypothetical protein
VMFIPVPDFFLYICAFFLLPSWELFYFFCG